MLPAVLGDRHSARILVEDAQRAAAAAIEVQASLEVSWTLVLDASDLCLGTPSSVDEIVAAFFESSFGRLVVAGLRDARAREFFEDSFEARLALREPTLSDMAAIDFVVES
jgi:hypothetical protein